MNTRTSFGESNSIRRDYEPGGDSELYTLESKNGYSALVKIGDDTVASYAGEGAWALAQRHALALLSHREILSERAEL
jgi:hypothetical protein